MNRKNRRMLARMKPEEIDAFIDRLCAGAKDEAFHKGQAQMLCLVLSFLHIDKGHTGAYLKKWLREMDSFAVSVNGYGPGSLLELSRILRDECGFDLEREYGALAKGDGRDDEP